MKAEKIPVLIGMVLIILLAFLIIWQAGIFGVSKDRLEQDARQKQHVAGSWEMAQAVDDNICAMLFYDEDKGNYAYSIYLTKGGLSYGYFYRQGGTDAYMEEGVKGLVFEDKGIALLSLNEDKVCKIVVDNNVEERTIQVDSDQPFAIVLPIDCSAITMYDAQENVVTLYDTFTGA
ncbi:MAG: hypothetical protein HFH93_12060 [Lachnospiraceae bacterium]|nr:hypothetical protein [Lachnospiraceae bacterium]